MMIRSAQICLIVLTMIGCGADTDGSGQSSYMAQVFDGGLSEERDGEISEDGSSIQSIWARRHVMAGIAELPAFGAKTNLTVTLSRVLVLKTADGLIAREETCDVQILRPEVTEIDTVIPEAFRASIAIIDRPLYVEDDGWTFGHAVQVQGAHLVDPHNDSLPADTMDPRVFDQDLDGLPGVTVLIDGILEGSVQVVQRTHTRMVGQRDGARIEGRLEWSSEESIIAASNPILENDVPLTPSPNPDDSDFQAVEVEPNVDCEQIRQQADSIFSP